MLERLGMDPLLRYHCALARIALLLCAKWFVVLRAVKCFVILYYEGCFILMYWPKSLEHSVVLSLRLLTAQRAAGGSIFLFLHISRAGMLWQWECYGTTSQLRGNHFLKSIWHDMKHLFFWKRNSRLCWGAQSHSVCLKIKNLRLGFLSPKFSFSVVRHLI